MRALSSLILVAILMLLSACASPGTKRFKLNIQPVQYSFHEPAP
jgi:hypothetical protein